MKALRPLLVLAWLLLALPLHAQWSGSVDAAAGFGMMPARYEDDFDLYRHMGKDTIRLNFKGSKFQWKNTLNGSYERVWTDSYRLALSESPEKQSTQLDEIQKLNLKAPYEIKLKSSFIWTPAARSKYEAWILFKFNQDSGNSATYKGHFKNIVQDPNTFQEKMYIETSEQNDLNYEVGLKTSHELGSPRRVLKGELVLEQNHRYKEGDWIMGNISAELEDFRTYRITPRSLVQKVQSKVHLADSIITSGPCRLMIDPGLRILGDFTRDQNRGATYDPATDTWRDSTRLRENFDFLALRIEPYLAGNFKWKGITAKMDYSPQLYARRLTDETHPQELQLKRIYLVGESRIDWKISPMHKLILRHKASVAHPSYIQICWYERQGNYLTQIYRGKESLLSTPTTAFNLEYEFRYKRFVSTTTMGYTLRNDEIDQTFTKEIIDGRDYQVFTWVNAADSRIVGFSEKLSWKGQTLKADVGVNYNGTVRKARESGVVKQTSDWRLWADVTLNLPKGWSIRADANYRSKVATFFTIFSKYCALNAKIQKNYKRVSIYLQGRDLLDNQVITQYQSEDGLNGWIELTRNNRRMVVLGVLWNFGK